MTSLATLFIVFGLLGYIRGREQIIQGNSRGFFSIVASMACFGALAIFSKESGVLLPLYAIVIEIAFYRHATAPGLARAFRWFWFGLFVAPLLAVAATVLLNKGDLLHLGGYQMRDFTLGERLLTETRVLWFYLTQIVAPDISQMGTYHDDFVTSRGLLDPPTTLASLAGLTALVIVSILAYRKHVILSFAIAWFFVGHSLESTVIPLLLVQEHRNYLPLYGILLAITYYIACPPGGLFAKSRLRFGLLILYLALLSGATYARSGQWRDEWTLYNYEVHNHPGSSRAHSMLAILMHDNLQYEAAAQHFTSAALLAPREIEPMIRLTQHLYLSGGKVPPEVLDELDQRVMQYPYSGVTFWIFSPLLKDTRSNRDINHRVASIYEKLVGRTDIQLGKGQRENSYMLLGSNYRDIGDYKRALDYYSLASAINDKAFYYLASADIYVKLEKPGDARRLIMAVKEKNLPLSESDRIVMDRLEKTLRRQAGTTRKH
jgi:tetratricopeptide (TPR) repeat protein